MADSFLGDRFPPDFKREKENFHWIESKELQFSRRDFGDHAKSILSEIKFILQAGCSTSLSYYVSPYLLLDVDLT